MGPEKCSIQGLRDSQTRPYLYRTYSSEADPSGELPGLWRESQELYPRTTSVLLAQVYSQNLDLFDVGECQKPDFSRCWRSRSIFILGVARAPGASKALDESCLTALIIVIKFFVLAVLKFCNLLIEYL